MYYLEFVSNICTVGILVCNSYESSLHEIKTLRKIQWNEHDEYIKPCKQAWVVHLSGWVQVLNIKSYGVDVSSLVIKENEAAI